jgi:hypothetical protein
LRRPLGGASIERRVRTTEGEDFVMRKKALFGLLALPLAFLLSSCFVLQGFWIKSNQISVGGKGTKAVFQIRPATSTDDRAYQFFLVGVDDDGDLKATKGTWGVNREFGGPYPLTTNANLATTIGSDCTSNGFDLAEVTGITWKGYITPTAINDKNKVKQDVITEVGIKANAGATSGDHEVLGVTGAWVDDDEDGVVEASDIFLCTGVSQVSVNVTT